MDLSGIGGTSARGLSGKVTGQSLAKRQQREAAWRDQAGHVSRLPSGWWLLPTMLLGAVIWLAIGRAVLQWL